MRRLGLDIGAKSIGWALFETKDDKVCKIVDLGVRIFSDGRQQNSQKSLTAIRRTARSMRRQRDRYLRRRTALMRKMSESGLMPSNPVEAKALERLDPYELRSRALDRALPLTHFGRALFHLSQRRGFKSNRNIHQEEKETNKIREASDRLDAAMETEDARTLGEFLHMRRQRAFDDFSVPSVRTRLGHIDVSGSDDTDSEDTGSDAGKPGNRSSRKGYQFYPQRRHIEDEFDKLWDAQAQFNSELSDSLRAVVREIIFHQRRLLPPRVGLCRFYDEKRLAKAHPLTQRRILYETVNSLRIAAIGKPRRALTLDQRDQVIQALDNRKHTASIKRMTLKLSKLAQLLKLADGEYFTLQTINRDEIACDMVHASLSHPKRFGSKWASLADEGDAQWKVVCQIRDCGDDDFDKTVRLLEQHHGLPPENAREAASAELPAGYGSLGETATRQILDKLKGQVIPYSEAVAACGMHHSDDRTGEILDKLPYYGEVLYRSIMPGTGNENDDDITRFGRIMNPTVHIGLNQLRLLMNAIIETHGLPDRIVVELARDLRLTQKGREEIEKENKRNRLAGKKRGETLERLGQPNNGGNRNLLRLLEQLNPKDSTMRKCPYSGQPITEEMLFDGSCHIDHILPYSQTLDNSMSNQTLCLKTKNIEKGRRTPWDAWGGTKKWEGIAEIIGHRDYPKDKKWRFEPDAMKRFDQEDGFLARSLHDTRYLSRIARQYLGTLYGEEEEVGVVPGKIEDKRVRVVPGQLTELLRRNWELNSLLPDWKVKHKRPFHQKNRGDHRHHAVDAAVIAATDRSLVQRIADATEKGEKKGMDAKDVVNIVARKVPAPWKGFRGDLETALKSIIVSHRADHGKIDISLKKIGRDATSNMLLQSTAYAIVGRSKLVSRMPFLELKAGQIKGSPTGKNIRDPELKRQIEKATAGKSGAELKAALRAFAREMSLNHNAPYRGIRRIRMWETIKPPARVEIRDSSGEVYKAYRSGGNRCFELWRLPNGTYHAKLITMLQAHSETNKQRNKNRPKISKHPKLAAKCVLKFFKRDMVAIEHKGQTKICYIQKLVQTEDKPKKMRANSEPEMVVTVFLAEHFEANARKRDDDRTDPFKIISLTGNSIIDTKIRRIRVDVMGRVTDPGAVNYD